MPKFSTNFKSTELCKTCGRIVWVKEDLTTFCSSGCHSPIFRKRVILKCDGCFKMFSLMPCYKRKSNYCSMKCYWNSTRRKAERICKMCGRKFLAKEYLLKRGYGLFCSRKCQHKTYPARILKFCKQCGKRIKVCPSQVHLIKFCSKACADSSMRDYVDMVCTNCKKPFQIPRSAFNRGRGKFCSYSCFVKYVGPSTLEEKMGNVLEKAGILFEREHKFKRFHTDFLIKKSKLVIECDGEYWHMRDYVRERDRRKDKYLKGLGYNILRLSGRTIIGSSDEKLIKLISLNL